MPQMGVVSVKIYDIQGKELEILTNINLNLGNYTINWNATFYPAGIYFIRMESGLFTETQKVILLK